MDDFTISPTRPSYASGRTDVPLLGDTIGDNFDRTVAAGPQHEALVEVATGRRWTYRQLRAEVDALALGLIDVGVVKGDRIGIWESAERTEDFVTPGRIDSSSIRGPENSTIRPYIADRPNFTLV
jgi:non-ribosomal peptide synthetase component F